jgi:CcmD family protein
MMTTMWTWILVALMAVMLAGAPALGFAQTPAPEGFVPVDQLPGQEELPAAPLVAAAYGVAWAAVLIYLFSIWRRLAAVEREMADVARRVSAGNR